MKLSLSTATLLFAASAALAQTSPGEQFLSASDLDGNGAATLAEVQQMRGNVFVTFDANDDGVLDAGEYDLFDAARAEDVANHEAPERAQMQKVADALRRETTDLNGDGTVSREEFVQGATAWFAALDKNADGAITMADFVVKR